MATAAELLGGTLTVDKTLVISNDLRKITIPSSVTNLGVESDDDVLRLKFKMPRYIGDVDLSVFSIRINYLNAEGEGDIYTVSDAVVGDQYTTFSWLVGPNATKYKGETKFNVCLRTLTADGTVDREYNTTIATLPVLEGLEVDESFIESYTDILEQWRRELFGIGDTEEASIKAVSAAEQEAIANKGTEVLATIPVDYQTAVSMTDNAERTKADAIICSTQGEAISVSDSSDDYLRGLRIFGRTDQVTTTGKNLLDVNENLYFTALHIVDTLIPAGTYALTWSNMTYGGNNKPVVRFADNEVLVDLSAISGNSAVTLTKDETTVYIYSNGYSYDNSQNVSASITKLMLSVDGGEYESYSGGFASPSPDWSQPLNSVQNPTAKVYGKNLLKFNHADNYLPGGVTLIEELEYGAILQGADGAVPGGSTYSSGWYQVCYNNRIPLKAGMCVTFSADYTVLENPHATTANISLHCSAKNSYSLTDSVRRPPDGVKTRISRTILINKDEEYFFTIGLNSCKVQIENIQLELSDTMSAYEPYVEPQSFALDKILPAVPVNIDGDYTDGNGQQWIGDEIDYERGVRIQRIRQLILTGNEQIVNVTGDYAIPLTTSVYAYDYADRVQCLCNYYPGVSRHDIAELIKTSGSLGVSANINYIRFADTLHYPTADVTAFRQFITDRYNAGDPVVVSYVLATPIETPLTADEIQWFRFAHTNYPNTTVLNDAGATMELKYNADTETWLYNLPKATEGQIQKYIDAWLDAHYTAAEGVSF